MTKLKPGDFNHFRKSRPNAGERNKMRLTTEPSLPLKTRSFLGFCVQRQRGPPGPRSQLFVSAIQSISMSNGPVHSGTQKKIRAGGLVGKKRL
jgi:hypothetical protein